LKDEEGRAIKLADFRGKKVVLYFYPRDLTPGCTKEACAFQEDLAEFEKRNAVVIGVSTDDARSHKRFREKYGLQFPLLTDDGHETAESYGVWQEKSMYGRKVWGIKRSTFIIDEQGRISHIFNKVSPAEHSREVLDVLDRL
jgi:peroxiredoxin Q/BCP